MKNIGNFLVGALSSLGVSAALPAVAAGSSVLPSTVIDSLEALVSMVSGILSAILVAWFKKKWGNEKVN